MQFISFLRKEATKKAGHSGRFSVGGGFAPLQMQMIRAAGEGGFHLFNLCRCKI